MFKGPVSEDLSTGNMVNRPKHYWNQNNSPLTNLLITAVKAIQLEKVSPSDMQNLRSVC